MVPIQLVTCSEPYGTNTKIIDFNPNYDEREEFYSNLVDSTCLSVDFEYTYNDIPESWVLGSNAWDYSKNTFNNYFNDGLTVVDDTPQVVVPESVPEVKECHIGNVQKRNNPCQFQPLIEYEIHRAEELFLERYS